MMRGLFVTGTGTDVGKTLVTAGSGRGLRRRAIDCMVMKPVQTGATAAADGRLIAPDVEAVLAAAPCAISATRTLADRSHVITEPGSQPRRSSRR